MQFFVLLAQEEPVPAWVENLPSPMMIGFLLFLILAAAIAYQYLKPKKVTPKVAGPEPIVLQHDVPSGPSTVTGKIAHLELYNVPVKLVAVVLAPTGRTQPIPDENQLRDLLESFLPGMMDAVRSHRPDFYRWPGQLSTTGFAQSFFVESNLPGERGKGTPWSAIAGKFETNERDYLIGLVCCADDNNGMDQITVDRPQQWLDIVRIKS
ncbi:MAG: hypothetical protein ACKVH8_02005 [Pirellulales bacterium]|jgi:hypothetical protein